MEMWDGGFEMPGDIPHRIPSSHVPMTTVTSKGVAQTIVADLANMAVPTLRRVDQSAVATRKRSRARRFDPVVTTWMGVVVAATLVWLFPTALHVGAVVSGMMPIVIAVVALGLVMEAAMSFDLRARISGGAPSGNDAPPLSEVCSQIRGSLKQYRPTGGELYDALVEATHRCCRIVNVARDTTDLQVIETVALVRSRLPALLTAYERTQSVGDPKELWAAVDRMAEAVIMIGDQAEMARKRLLALATDGLETEVRYLSARTGRDDLGLSSMLAPVN